MSKKPIIGGIILAAIIGVVFVGAQINPDNPENEENRKSEVWSTRISGVEFPAELDSIRNEDGTPVLVRVYGPITLEREVPYEFSFVPMGDSPDGIVISVVQKQMGLATIFSESFILEGTLVEAGTSKWYTWDYVGNKNFEIEHLQCREKTCKYDIIVERYGNLKGSVTISLSR